VVPVVGDVMASRWAFEALAVNQFKNNRYEKDFFPIDGMLSRSTYKKDWWLPILQERSGKCRRILMDNQPRAMLDSPLVLLRNEIVRENFFNQKIQFPFTDKLSPDAFNQTVLDSLNSYLDRLSEHYKRMFNRADEIRESMIQSKLDNESKKAEFTKLKKNYFNKSLDELVRNSNTTERLSVENNRIIQWVEPVFREISPEHFLRTFFYSNGKYVFGKVRDTFTVNLMVIWSMTVLLYFTLQTDLLRKILQFSERFRKKG